MKTNKSIMIVYRNNDLFEKQIPLIVEGFSLMGRKVKIKSFPESTIREEITDWYWYKENIRSFKDKEFITDKTADIPWGLRKNIKQTDLDNLLLDITKRAIFGEEYKRFQTEIEKREGPVPEKHSKEWYTRMVKEIITDSKKIPDETYIFLDRISDHSNAYDQKEKINSLEKSVAEKFRGWLISAGLNSEKIKIVQQLSSSNRGGISYFLPGGRKVVREIDKPGYWTIVDRHAKNIVEEIKNAKCLQLPEVNFYESAVKQGLLEPKDKDFSNAAKEVLKEKFG